MTVVVAKPLAAAELFEEFGELFLQGRLDDLAELWSVPCPVQLGDQLTVVRSPDELVDYLRIMRERMMHGDVVALSPELVGIEIPRDGRFRVWMRWSISRGDGSVNQRSAVYHLHRRSPSTLCIEGMEVPADDLLSEVSVPSPFGAPPTGPPSGGPQERARVRVALFDLLERLGLLLTEGRFGELGELHVFPCPYEAEGAYEVMMNPEMLAEAVGRWTEAKRAQGVRRFEARLVAQEMPRGRRMRAWIRWVHTMRDGSQEFVGTDLLFLARRPDGRLAIEMIDFQSLPGPDHSGT